MKNIKVYNKKNELISDHNHYQNENDFINFMISNNYFGKPQRWILENSESYDSEDVLNEESRKIETGIVNQNPDGSFSSQLMIERWVLLKSDYRFEVQDLDTDYDWLLSECHRKRKEEYPPLSELGDALYWKENGDTSKYDQYIKKCDEVKKKYPLPIK